MLYFSAAERSLEKRPIILLTFCIVYSMSLIYINSRRRKKHAEKFYQQRCHLTRANIRQNKCTATWAKRKAHKRHTDENQMTKKIADPWVSGFFWVVSFLIVVISASAATVEGVPTVDGATAFLLFYLLLKVIKLQLQSIK